MSAPKILIIDSLYPDFIRTVPVDPNAGYEANLRKILGRGFGTSDSYSRNLRALGWDAVDVIANHGPLQMLWARQYWEKAILDLELTGNIFATTTEILEAQIRHYQPDVLFFQDLSLLRGLNFHYDNMIVAGQCSCPFPEGIPPLDVVFTSFPHFVERFQANGHTRAVYNPLAFEPSVGDRCFPSHMPAEPTESLLMNFGRIHDVVFIGGVGAPSHWRYGMEVLETVAREIDGFRWWGYGHHESLSADLKTAFEGEAWGLDMFEVLLRSKIAIARHGEVAEGFANNMKLFETTGAGCLLMTEAAPNLSDFFAPDECVTYTSPDDAVAKIRYYLQHEDERAKIAANGQARTLRDHTYAQRMKVVSETLKAMLVAA